MVENFDCKVAAQVLYLPRTYRKAKKLLRHLGQLMRFIDHYGVGAGQ